MNLPKDFKDRIISQIPDEAEAFFKTYDEECHKGLRLNMLKKNAENIPVAESDLNFELEPISWADGGFYYDDKKKPGSHPYHEAGLYYIQEPSAMAPVSLLEVKPGEKVLDLCAAPGGKSTQIASFMDGKGLLVSNEIHPARAKILSENIERMGVKNAIVTNESPDRLSNVLPGFFDKILVDAPCSGEGMFRKNPDAISEWSLDNVKLCAERQDMILDEAYKMLRSNGRMVYSTCTFAPEEDEECMARFVSRHPDMILLKTVRIWPHKVKGEGHFAAVLTKGEESFSVHQESKCPIKTVSDKELCDYKTFLSETLNCPNDYLGNIILFKERLCLLPDIAININGLKVERVGLELGELKKNRFEPSHSLALALSPSEVRNSHNLTDVSKMSSYIGGESFPLDAPKGWYLICVSGFSLAWGKCAGGIMKNHYPKGLRK